MSLSTTLRIALLLVLTAVLALVVVVAADRLTEDNKCSHLPQGSWARWSCEK